MAFRYAFESFRHDVMAVMFVTSLFCDRSVVRHFFALDLQKFNAQLAALGLVVKDVAGDGNCMFRAICDQFEVRARDALSTVIHEFALAIVNFLFSLFRDRHKTMLSIGKRLPIICWRIAMHSSRSSWARYEFCLFANDVVPVDERAFFNVVVSKTL